MLTVVAAAVLLGAGHRGIAQQQGVADLPSLSATYQQLGLPLPPSDAEPVWWRHDPVDGFGNGMQYNGILVGFVERRAKGGARVWIGLGWVIARDDEPSTKYGVTWLLANANHGPPPASVPAPILGYLKTWYWEDVALAFAVQMYLRGDAEQAKALVGRTPAQWPLGSSYGLVLDVGSAPQHTYGTRMGYLALDYWLGELLDIRQPRARILRGLQSLDESGQLEHKAGLRTLISGLQDLLRSQAYPAIDPVDRYLDDCVLHGANLIHGSGPVDREGLACAHSLIDHLDDIRPTNQVAYWPAPHPMTAGDIVSRLLVELSAGSLNPRFGKEDAQNWLASALASGEERYVMDRVLITQRGLARTPNWLLLPIIEHKYPRDLPAVYMRALAASPEIETRGIAEALVRARLPACEKLRALLQGASAAPQEAGMAALAGIAQVDRKSFIHLLARVLANYQRPTMEPPEDAGYFLAHAVSLANTSWAWKALARISKDEPKPFLEETIVSPAQTAGYAEYLSSFLDDGRPADEGFTGGRAGVTVGGIAAIALNDVEQLNLDPPRVPRPEAWSTYARQVARAYTHKRSRKDNGW